MAPQVFEASCPNSRRTIGKSKKHFLDFDMQLANCIKCSSCLIFVYFKGPLKPFSVRSFDLKQENHAGLIAKPPANTQCQLTNKDTNWPITPEQEEYQNRINRIQSQQKHILSALVYVLS